MLAFLNPFPARRRPDREVLLQAIPVRNTLVEESRRAAGPLRLTAPVQQTLFKKIFGQNARQRSFDLDDLGAVVWAAIDWRSSVEHIITVFAREQRVNLREAEVSVRTFLRMLMQRNLIALAAGAGHAPPPRRPGKKRQRK